MLETIFLTNLTKSLNYFVGLTDILYKNSNISRP